MAPPSDNVAPINFPNRAMEQAAPAPQVREQLNTTRPDEELAGAPSKPPLATVNSIASETSKQRAALVDSLQSMSAEVAEAIDTLNQALARSPTRAMISRDEELNRYIVKITDERSGEVIREIPSEALLKFARNLRELKGLLFDQAL